MSISVMFPPQFHLRSSQDLVWAEKTLEELQARLSLRLGVEPELEQLDWSVSDNMFLHIDILILGLVNKAASAPCPRSYHNDDNNNDKQRT